MQSFLKIYRRLKKIGNKTPPSSVITGINDIS